MLEKAILQVLPTNPVVNSEDTQAGSLPASVRDKADHEISAKTRPRVESMDRQRHRPRFGARVRG